MGPILIALSCAWLRVAFAWRGQGSEEENGEGDGSRGDLMPHNMAGQSNNTVQYMDSNVNIDKNYDNSLFGFDNVDPVIITLVATPMRERKDE